MRKQHQIAWTLWGIAFFSTLFSYAQTNLYKANLAPVHERGYYNIELDPRIVGNAKEDLSNLRIYQRNQEQLIEVPYFIRAVQPSSKEANVIDYTITPRMEQDSINRFVIHNPAAKKTTDFYVTINKADVTIHATVKGSNNNQDWFIVKQKTPIYTYTSSDTSEVTLFVSIPEGHYKYYEMELINNQSTPLKVNKVSTVVDTKTYGQFSPTLLQSAGSQTNQKNKTTTISFVQQALFYKLNKVAIKVDAPQDYYRKAMLRDSITKIAVPLILSSKSRNEFILDDIMVQHPYVEIYNGNNPPLEIQSIETYALTRFATAYLEADKVYEIVVDQSRKDVPEYDIQYFKQDIPLTLPVVLTQDFNHYEQGKSVLEDSKNGMNQTNKILWGVLLLVGLFIGYICFKTFRKLEK